LLRHSPQRPAAGQREALAQSRLAEHAEGGEAWWAAKVENFFSSFFEPHSGQAGLTELDATSNSTWPPQPLHVYS